jgi:methyl-accepting chemotaxis protein
MLKLRSISARLILAISLTVAVACAILGSFSIWQQRTLTQLALEQQLKLQYDSVVAAIDYEGRATLAVSSVIAALPPVGEAIAKGDRDGLAALLGGAMEALKVQGIPLITFETQPSFAFYRVHAPKVFGDDMSGRRNTVVEALRTGRQIVGVEPGRELLSVFGMTPIIRDGKAFANVDVGANFGQEFVDRAKKRFGIDLAVYSFSGNDPKRISSTLGDEAVATPEELKSVFTGAALHRDATFAGHPAALYVGQIKNYAGQPVAVLELIKDTTAYEAAAASSRQSLILATLAILAGAALSAFLLGRGLSRPLTAITVVMNRLSGGDVEVKIPGGERRDELGTMAQAVDVFRRNMLEARALREAQEGAKQQAEIERKALQRQMADRFEADVKSVVAAVAKATEDMQLVATDHRKRQWNLAARNDCRRGFRASLRQRRHGGVRDRGARLFRRRNRPPGQSFQQRGRGSRGQGRQDHRNGGEPRRHRRQDRRRASPDRRHRKPDQFVGAQRHHRGGARRRGRPRLCRGRGRSEDAGGADGEGDR